MTFDELPIEWQQRIKRLRTHSARYRTQRNELREQLSALTNTHKDNNA
ncbi:hypothetical protein JWS13_10035 [Rhodococcus pseudokoreensis]|uniref:Uncharacterized protein n=1 Tax=Rhodococcus pseudokoreensis TaxID=2811421 RepID=A0A974W0V8_9NOCA|nr:hypothetical protein [Rhodococcus pseudokoreensis]QSE88921.1 hypothetical protein JWS13_10035 [Rhodococcus pseudokoreensis]